MDKYNVLELNIVGMKVPNKTQTCVSCKCHLSAATSKKQVVNDSEFIIMACGHGIHNSCKSRIKNCPIDGIAISN